MISEKVDVHVYRRKYTLEIEGITELEANALAQQLTDRMEKIAEELQYADTTKVAVITALNILHEMSQRNSQHKQERETEDRVLDRLAQVLRDALQESGAPAQR